MQEGRILKTDVAEFVPTAWTGVNTSGFAPMHTNIMVLPDGVNEKTHGGVFLPGAKRDQMATASESGVVVAMGDEAFRRSPDGEAWAGIKPGIGSHVYFERYAGQVLSGRDGKQYRVMDAKCVGAIAVEEIAS